MKATLLYECKDSIGEAATWLNDLGLFLWVDINGGLLHTYSPDGDAYAAVRLPARVSTIVPMTDGRLLLSLQGRLIAYDLRTGEQEVLRELFRTDGMMRPNDGKASPEGRLWLGMMHLSDHSETGALYRVDPDLSIHKMLDKQCIPNGIVWSEDGSRMYYVDSGRHVVESYRYDMRSGELSYEKPALEIPEDMGVPDGMTIDADGNLWIAHWGGFGVCVWNPLSGELLDKVEVPVPNVASCTFGRDGLLYITTAMDGLSMREREAYPLSGSLFVASTGMSPGKNHYPFRRI